MLGSQPQGLQTTAQPGNFSREIAVFEHPERPKPNS